MLYSLVWTAAISLVHTEPMDPQVPVHTELTQSDFSRSHGANALLSRLIR